MIQSSLPKLQRFAYNVDILASTIRQSYFDMKYIFKAVLGSSAVLALRLCVHLCLHSLQCSTCRTLDGTTILFRRPLGPNQDLFRKDNRLQREQNFPCPCAQSKSHFQRKERRPCPWAQSKIHFQEKRRLRPTKKENLFHCAHSIYLALGPTGPS